MNYDDLSIFELMSLMIGTSKKADQEIIDHLNQLKQIALPIGCLISGYREDKFKELIDKKIDKINLECTYEDRKFGYFVSMGVLDNPFINIYIQASIILKQIENFKLKLGEK